jgi:hypothetical protein
MKKKRVNPNRRLASMADLNRAKKEAKDKAVEIAWSIFFTVLCDKEGYTREDLRRIWNEVEDLSDSIAKGYCTVKDLRSILHDEMGVDLKD